MTVWYVAIALLAIFGLLAASIRIFKQHERGVQFRLGKLRDGERGPGRNLQTLIEISVDKNSTVVFPAPLMSTINDLGAFIAREAASAAGVTRQSRPTAPPANGTRTPEPLAALEGGPPC